MGRPPLSEREPYDTERLTDVALELFKERGYDATSMADIAGAAGIQKSSLYHHVHGKEELLSRGVNRALDALFEVLDEPLASTGPAVDRLRYVLARAIEIEVGHLAETTVLVRLRGNTELERSVLERRQIFDAAVAQLVGRAQDEASIRRDIDPALATRLLMGILLSLTEWFQVDGKHTWRDMADGIFLLAFDGLAT
jgi:AcrR family transcriptional regulator